MGDREQDRQPVEGSRPVTAEEVPGEEDPAQTEVEGEQYDDPTLEIPIADRDKPEDR